MTCTDVVLPEPNNTSTHLLLPGVEAEWLGGGRVLRIGVHPVNNASFENFVALLYRYFERYGQQTRLLYDVSRPPLSVTPEIHQMNREMRAYANRLGVRGRAAYLFPGDLKHRMFISMASLMRREPAGSLLEATFINRVAAESWLLEG